MLQITLFLLGCSSVLSIELYKPVYNIEHNVYYFNDFINTYNKQYSSENEKQERLKIFTENLKKMNKLNAATDTSTHGINQFADLTREEFGSAYKGLMPIEIQSSCTPVTDASIVTNQAPDAFDWRNQNVVSPVKNQLMCGSCYTFSTTGNIESLYAIKNGGTILDLSEQQLVDCSTVNYHCDGGIMAQCMTEIMEMGGLESEQDYPYVLPNGTCRFQQSLAKVQLSGCKQYMMQDENRLKEELYQNGPIAIGVAGDDLQVHHGGIMTTCSGAVDHAVLLVGYGSENGLDFWSIKNSWGSEWGGEQGYFRIARGQNMCSLMNNLMSTAIVA